MYCGYVVNKMHLENTLHILRIAFFSTSSDRCTSIIYRTLSSGERSRIFFRLPINRRLCPTLLSLYTHRYIMEAPIAMVNYNGVIMSIWRLKSPALPLFTQPFIQGKDQGKHQSSASLAFLRGIHRSPMNSPHKGPVTQKMFPFDDIIMVV